jgi:hypothetical protein
MSTRNNILGAALALGGLVLTAQVPDAQGSLKIDFPKDSPVTLVSADWGQSKPTARGGAMILDLHSALSLRNSSARRIRGVTLIVLAQEVTPGGKGSVSVPSLDVAPGETFPIRIDLRLLRPVQGAESMPVQVGLDGVLFDDLTFFGPNRLNSRRSMIVWELEAQRDRQYFKSVFERAGTEGLQKEMLSAMARIADRPQSGVQMVRGRSTNYEPEREMQFAFLQFPGAPVEPLGGIAHIAGNEARAPRLEIRNRSTKPVKYLEIGWIVEDQQGREFLAGSVPAELNLAPGAKSQVLQDTALRFPDRTGIKGMTAFVNSVEYSDGRYWIPNRADIGGDRLRRLLAPSPEEQRLVQIYRKKGLKALVEELKKF